MTVQHRPSVRIHDVADVPAPEYLEYCSRVLELPLRGRDLERKRISDRVQSHRAEEMCLSCDRVSGPSKQVLGKDLPFEMSTTVKQRLNGRGEHTGVTERAQYSRRRWVQYGEDLVDERAIQVSDSGLHDV